MTAIETLGPQAAYQAHLEAGRFMIQRAKSTGEYVFWPRVLTPSGATDLEWVPAKGTGTVYAITVNRARGAAGPQRNAGRGAGGAAMGDRRSCVGVPSESR